MRVENSEMEYVVFCYYNFVAFWPDSTYSHLSNKRGGGAKFAKSLTAEVGINVEGEICGKK